MVFIYRSGVLHVESVMMSRAKVSMANIIFSGVRIFDRMRDHLTLNFTVLVCWSKMQMSLT